MINNNVNVLIVYYSLKGSTEKMAHAIAQGVMSGGASFTLRTVPKVSPDHQQTLDEIPSSGAIYASLQDIQKCDALIVGSPTRFGNMAAPMKYFLDSLSQEWVNGTLAGKPAGVFTSCSTMHGGHESTLMSMMLPLFHLGALMVGVDPNCADLHHTVSGGTPYGPSHYSGGQNASELSTSELAICKYFGARIAKLARALSHN